VHCVGSKFCPVSKFILFCLFYVFPFTQTGHKLEPSCFFVLVSGFCATPFDLFSFWVSIYWSSINFSLCTLECLMLRNLENQWLYIFRCSTLFFFGYFYRLVWEEVKFEQIRSKYICLFRFAFENLFMFMFLNILANRIFSFISRSFWSCFDILTARPILPSILFV
jgi:hypothetical protein